MVLDLCSIPRSCLLATFPPNPILRGTSRLAPEYHREYGRAGGFDPRNVSGFTVGSPRDDSGARSSDRQSCISAGFHASHHCVMAEHVLVHPKMDGCQPQRCRLPVWSSKGECYLIDWSTPQVWIRYPSFTAAQRGINRRPHSGASYASFEIDCLRHESCVLADWLDGFAVRRACGSRLGRAPETIMEMKDRRYRIACQRTRSRGRAGGHLAQKHWTQRGCLPR